MSFNGMEVESHAALPQQESIAVQRYIRIKKKDFDPFFDVDTNKSKISVLAGPRQRQEDQVFLSSIYQTIKLPKGLKDCFIVNLDQESFFIELSKKSQLSTILYVPGKQYRQNSKIEGVVVVREVGEGGFSLPDQSKDMAVVLMDENDKEISIRKVDPKVSLSEFEFEIDEFLPSGNYRLDLKDMEDGSVWDSSSVEIVRFEKPDIKVEEQELENYYLTKQKTMQHNFNVEYFWNEPIKKYKEIVYTLNGVEQKMKAPPKDWTFTNSISKSGSYDWELKVVDEQGRHGKSSGSFQVYDQSALLTFPSMQVKDRRVKMTIKLTDPESNPIPDCQLKFQIEQENQWNVTSPSLKTDQGGRVQIVADYKGSSKKVFKVFVSAHHDNEDIYGHTQVNLSKIEETSKKSAPLTLIPSKTTLSAGEELKYELQFKDSQIDFVAVNFYSDYGLYHCRDVKVAGTFSFIIPKELKERRFKLDAWAYSGVKALYSDSVDIELTGTKVDGFFTPKLVGPDQVATGKQIKLSLQDLPKDQNFEIVSFMVDKRIPHKNFDRNVVEQFVQISGGSVVKLLVSQGKKGQLMSHPLQWAYFPSVTGHWTVAGNAEYLIAVQSSQQLIFDVTFKKNVEIINQRLGTETVFKFLNAHKDDIGLEVIEIFKDNSRNPTHHSGESSKLKSDAKFFQIARAMFGYQEILRPTGGMDFLGFGSPQPIMSRTNDLFGSFQAQPMMAPTSNAFSFGSSAPAPQQQAIPTDDFFSLDSALPPQSNKDNLMDMDTDEDWADFEQEKSRRRQPARKIIVRENFVEIQKHSTQSEQGEDVSIDFPASDAITTYKIITIAASETMIGYCSHDVLIKNQIFTSINNQSTIKWGEETTIQATVSNLTKTVVPDISVSLFPLKGIDNVDRLFKSSPFALAAGQSKTFSVPIKATKCGDAKLHVLMQNPKFQELNSLDTPLYVEPCGEPDIETTNQDLDRGTAIEFKFNYKPKDHIFALGTLSILPSPQSAIIEGVESLMCYPYGCCEQTYSKTLPFIILHQYYEEKGELTEELEKKVIKGLTKGRDRFLSVFYNPVSGGCGLWNSQRPGVFHTALVLSVLSRMVGIIDIDRRDLAKMTSFLKSNQAEDGSWGSIRQTYDPPFPDNTQSVHGATSFIFNACSMAKTSLPNTLKWLKDHFSTYQHDSNCMSMIVMGLQEMYPDETAFQQKLLTRIAGLQSKDGSWSADSSLCGRVESTACALIALHKSNFKRVLVDGLQFILQNRQTSGWSSTRDTVYAAWAVSKVGTLIFGNQDQTGKLRVWVNQDLVREFDFSKAANNTEKLDLIYQARRIYLDQWKEGSNTIKIESIGKIKANVMLEKKIHWLPTRIPIQLKQQQQSNKNQIDMDIETSFSTKKFRVGQQFVLRANITAKSTIDACMFIFENITGTELTDLGAVKYDDNIFSFVELNPETGKVGLFCDEFKSGTKTTIQVPLQCCFESKKVIFPGIRVLPMYDTKQEILIAPNKSKNPLGQLLQILGLDPSLAEPSPLIPSDAKPIKSPTTEEIVLLPTHNDESKASSSTTTTAKQDQSLDIMQFF